MECYYCRLRMKYKRTNKNMQDLLIKFDWTEPNMKIHVPKVYNTLSFVELSKKLERINRGSYMSAHVLLNLLNELGKRDKMRGLPSILSLFRNKFNKFNNTRA